MSGTSTDLEKIRGQIAERERSIQTAFPGKVIAYDAATGTVKLEPQFLETWRSGTERVSEAVSSENYIENVPVCFPRSGDFSITFPIATGSFGLVLCTKYSLDVWREAGTATDPGDLRRFTLSGATFHPVNLSPTASQLTSIDTSHIILSEGGATDYVALKADVQDIKTFLDEIKTDFNSHTHAGVTAGGSTTATPVAQITSTYTVQASTKVKVE